MTKVKFEVVQIYRNNSIYETEFSLEPLSHKATECYCIKIGTDTFFLGDKGNGLYIAEENRTKE